MLGAVCQQASMTKQVHGPEGPAGPFFLPPVGINRIIFSHGLPKLALTSAPTPSFPERSSLAEAGDWLSLFLTVIPKFPLSLVSRGSYLVTSSLLFTFLCLFLAQEGKGEAQP